MSGKITKRLKSMTNQIKDAFTKQNFTWIKEFVDAEDVLNSGFKHLVIDLTNNPASSTTQKVPHGLKFIPADVILTSVTNGAAVTFDHEAFDKDTITLTVDDACMIRLFLGRFE